MDPPEKNREFAKSLEIDYPILSDPDRKTAGAWGVLDPEEGKYAQRWTYYIGVDGKILKIDREVSPDTAGADVAATLGSLGVKPAP